jgi:hypothetical protein
MQNSYSSVNLTTTGQDESSSEESVPPNIQTSPTKPSGENFKKKLKQYFNKFVFSTTSTPNSISGSAKNHQHQHNAQLKEDGACCRHDRNAVQR